MIFSFESQDASKRLIFAKGGKENEGWEIHDRRRQNDGKRRASGKGWEGEVEVRKNRPIVIVSSHGSFRSGRDMEILNI